jgi:hypothetical protein
MSFGLVAGWGRLGTSCYRIKRDTILYISAHAPTPYVTATITANYHRLFNRRQIPDIQTVTHSADTMQTVRQQVHLMWNMFLLILLHDVEHSVDHYMLHSRRRSPYWRAAVPLIQSWSGQFATKSASYHLTHGHLRSITKAEVDSILHLAPWFQAPWHLQLNSRTDGVSWAILSSIVTTEPHSTEKVAKQTYPVEQYPEAPCVTVESAPSVRGKVTSKYFFRAAVTVYPSTAPGGQGYTDLYDFVSKASKEEQQSFWYAVQQTCASHHTLSTEPSVGGGWVLLNLHTPFGMRGYRYTLAQVQQPL